MLATLCLRLANNIKRNRAAAEANSTHRPTSSKNHVKRNKRKKGVKSKSKSKAANKKNLESTPEEEPEIDAELNRSLQDERELLLKCSSLLEELGESNSKIAQYFTLCSTVHSHMALTYTAEASAISDKKKQLGSLVDDDDSPPSRNAGTPSACSSPGSKTRQEAPKTGQEASKTRQEALEAALNHLKISASFLRKEEYRLKTELEHSSSSAGDCEFSAECDPFLEVVRDELKKIQRQLIQCHLQLAKDLEGVGSYASSLRHLDMALWLAPETVTIPHVLVLIGDLLYHIAGTDIAPELTQHKQLYKLLCEVEEHQRERDSAKLAEEDKVEKKVESTLKTSPEPTGNLTPLLNSSLLLKPPIFSLLL